MEAILRAAVRAREIITGTVRGRTAVLYGRAVTLGIKLAPGGALVALTALALAERVAGGWRRVRGAPPRLMWGPTAILNVKSWSDSMRARGYESRTCMLAPSSIGRREDFDRYLEDFGGTSLVSDAVRTYLMFAWTLRHGDVFFMFFDGGFLRGTALEPLEYRLLRLAGKKLVVSPYGGDIAVPGHLGALEEPLLSDYPELPAHAELFKWRIRNALKWANVSILNYTRGFQPRRDVAWPTQVGIDVEEWHSSGDGSTANGRQGSVVVVHAPNHRHIKGTAFLEAAVEELRKEGLEIDLRILEGVPNEEVRWAVLAADVVADQFLMGYGLFAIEGMAAGKPVLSNMSQIPNELRGNQSLLDCPVVDTDPESLRGDLRRLVTKPMLRGELGRAGREFVIRYHSHEAVGENWEAIVDHVWRGKPLPERMLPRERSG